MLGSINDPEDGKSVAATVFGAVVVYIVSSPLPLVSVPRTDETAHRASSCSAPAKPGSTAGSALSSYTNCKLLALFCFIFYSRTAILGTGARIGAGIIHVVAPEGEGGRETRKNNNRIQDLWYIPLWCECQVLQYCFFFFFLLHGRSFRIQTFSSWTRAGCL